MKVGSVVLATALALGTVLGMSMSQAKEVTGKVLAIYYEPVTVNNKVLDKVSLTVQACSPSPTPLVTAHYAPGAVSDDNSLGYLFNHGAVAARSGVQKNQYMNSVSGHVTLSINDQTQTIQKTTFWGYNWECGKDLDRGGASATNGSPANAAPATGSPSAPAKGNFGGVNPLHRFGF